ncbi:MAG: amidohydrolase [Bryobacteraceae bacterium]|nr:amidohydrolase [Bryobacteraceae bacterium]
MSDRQSRRDFLKCGTAPGLCLAFGGHDLSAQSGGQNQVADLILLNGKVTTLDKSRPNASALAANNGRFLAVGSDRDALRFRGQSTHVINAGGRRVIPGLNDSHTHPIRGGLNYNMELRWDGAPSLADALRMLKEQARRTPPPQWARVVGGWTPEQFAEKRMPTLAEINEATGDTPAFILHLYDRAFLNRAALRALGYDKEVPQFPASEVERDTHGNPTGLLIAKPNALILYSTLAKAPKLDYQDQVNSTRQFMRELNRLGVTSVIDAGGGFQNYPADYAVVEDLNRNGLLTVRFAYNLFTQHPQRELGDFAAWIKLVKPGQGNDMYRHNGAGEMLVYSAADFEDFVEPRPEMPERMDAELREVVTLLARNRWPFRLHATYDETIGRALNIFEEVNREALLRDLHWFFDHAETISDRNLERVKALGGGIAIQHRMAYQGEAFVARYGKKAGESSPPVRKMLAMGIPVGAGTDATRVASYNPWVALYWLVSGKTVGGMSLYPSSNRLDRSEALRLMTHGSAWFSGEQETKGTIAPGQLGDFAVLSDDYFSVPEEKIKQLESVLTVVAGRVAHGAGEFAKLAPPLPPASPDWSPARIRDGYWRGKPTVRANAAAAPGRRHGGGWFGADGGCDC